MEAFFHHRDILFGRCSEFFVIVEFGLKVFGGFWGWCEVGHVFFMSNGGGIILKFGLGVALWWFWDSENMLKTIINRPPDRIPP